MPQSDSIFEVNDRVIIMDGEWLGCTGKVTTVGAGGLLVVKPDQPAPHAAIVVADTSVYLRDLAKSPK
jgi:hypothetical protein